MFLLPHAALFRAIHLFHQRTYYFALLENGDELGTIFLMLFLDIFIWGGIAWYLQQVAPSEDSVQKSYCFCLTEPIQKCLNASKGNINNGNDKDNMGYGQRLLAANYADSTANLPISAPAVAVVETKNVAFSGEGKNNGMKKRRASFSNKVVTVQEDEDVMEERQKMIDGTFPKEAPVQVYGIRKKFGNFVAVDNVSLHIPNGQCFGMLGPNGAGKTTTISMLTGLIPATKGDASIAGKDLHTELPSIFSNIGVCPQFDVCWPELTIEEHLRFYARVKGVPRLKEDEEINKLINDIGLIDAHKKKSISKALSGGMRRRLSLAIALVGKPPVVFLDEPTTGLDPETKRNIWKLIDTFKKGRCVVLTTHSMDEADALCQRIGIMSHGRLRCIGENLHLKNIYGSGYKIDVRYVDGKKENAIQYFRKTVPTAHLDSHQNHSGMLEFQLTKGSMKLSKVMRSLNNAPASAGILNYGIRQTSLKEVFLRIGRESEAAFAAQKKK